MSGFRFAGVVTFVVLLVMLARLPAAIAADKPAAELLPPTTVAYIEISKTKDLVSFLFDSPLRKQIDQSDEYRKAIDSPKFREFQAVVGLIEQRADVKWRDALENAGAGGIVLAFDGETQGVVLLAKSGDGKKTDAVRDTLFSIAREDAKNKGNPDPIGQKDYRGLTAYTLGEGVLSDLGPWLLFTNKPALAKSIADRYLDGSASLAADRVFSDERRAAGAGPTAWAFVRLEPLRAIAGDNPILDPKYKSDNAAGEFLLGGLLPVIRKAEYVSASLTLNGGDVKLSLSAPVDLAALTQEKKFFFAAPGDGAAKPLRPPGTMLSVSMYRDSSALWQAGPDLFTDAVATQMAQADSGLSTFFGGKSFGADVLGTLKPQIQIVAAKQDYKVAGVNEPALKLPGFALVVAVKGEKFAELKKHLRVGFQSAIALGNLDGTSKGRPALELQSEKRGGCDIQYATYDMTDKATAKDDAYLNFSPAIVMSEKYLMICTTKQIAEQLADLAEKETDGKNTIAANTFLKLDGAAIASLIQADREQLIAQNMLEKGHDRAEAEKAIDVLQKLVSYVQEAEINLTPGPHAIQLDVNVKTPAN